MGSCIARHLLLVWVLSCSCVCVTVGAHTGESACCDFDISQPTLGEALQALAKQAGTQLLVPSELARTKGVYTLVGRYGVNEALQVLLRDTAFTGNLTASGVITITPRLRSADNNGGMMTSSTAASSKKTVSILTLILSALMSSKGQAQADDSGGTAALDEVIVTAQRRAERLQDVPVAAVAFSAAQLKSMGITDTQALTEAVSGVSFVRSGPSGLVFIRGVGTTEAHINDEPSVATYIDGVYIASPLANIFSLNNVERVEVLKGPQGTLFGRNATGGVVQIVTREPSQTPHIEANLGYGNFDTVEGSLYATTGLTDELAADIAVMASHQGDGWGTDLTTGGPTYLQKDWSARSKLLFNATDKLRAELAIDYTSFEYNGLDERQPAGVTGLAGLEYPGYYNSNADTPGFAHTRQGGASLRVDYDFDVVKFASISAYRRVKGPYRVDEDTTELHIVDVTLNQDARTYSQELQMMAREGSKVQWIVGGYYFDMRGDFNPVAIQGLSQSALPSSSLQIYSGATTKSDAFYGQATTAVLPDTNLTLGYRYTRDKQTYYSTVLEPILGVLGVGGGRQQASKSTFRVALDHHITPDILAYASYNEGFKSGGFNILVPGVPGFQPESIKAYEVGLKNQFFNRRLQLNVAGFVYDYRNLQQAIAETAGSYVINAARAKVRGVDLDLAVAATDRLTLSLATTYLHSVYSDFPDAPFYPHSAPAIPVSGSAAGLDTQQAPRWSGSLNAMYNLPTAVGKFELSTNFSYNSGFSFTPDNALRSGPYGLINASLRWTSLDEHYNVRLWGRNLANREYLNAATQASGIGDLVLPAAPRTYGISLGVNF